MNSSSLTRKRSSIGLLTVGVARFLTFAASLAVVWVVPVTSKAQIIYTSNVVGYNTNASIVSEYDATTGATINGSFITGSFYTRYWPYSPSLALSGNNLYVAASGVVGEYNATTGAAINATLITGLSLPQPDPSPGGSSIAISGNDLYVSNGGVVAEYNATTGTVINAGLVTNLAPLGGGPVFLAVSGNNLYISSPQSGFGGQGGVGLYDATTGAAINATLIYEGGGYSWTRFVGPLAVSGDNLYVSLNGSVGLFNATTGAAINTSFINNGSGGVLALSGNDLFISTGAEYNATTGAAINATFFSGGGEGSS